MKDVYIKQLTRFSQTDSTQDQLVIQTLSGIKFKYFIIFKINFIN